MIKTTLLTSLLAMALGLGATVAPPPVLVAFKMNPALIISMYNVAQQHQGEVTEYPADMNPAVVQLTCVNNSGAPVTPCFRIVIKEPGRAGTCADDPATTNINEATSPETLITGGYITSKIAIPADGQPHNLSAADLVTSGSFSGSVNTCFRNEFEGDFQGGVDPAKLQKTVERIMKKRFQVCLIQTWCPNGADVSGAEACDFFTLMLPQSGNVSSVAILNYPHNNRVPTSQPMFMWFGAQSPSIPQSEISYNLEIREGEPDGELLERVRTPKGAMVYQWSAGNRKLEAGKRYWWRVVSIDDTGNTFGGPGGQGWNVTKWFEVDGVMIPLTLVDVDKLVKDALKNGPPDTGKLIEGMKINKVVQPADLADKLWGQIQSGEATVVGVEVTGK